MLDLTIYNIVAFFLIFFIGLPHGSFDGAVASLVGVRTKIQFIKFLLYYLVLSIFVIIFWLYFPIIALIIFILMTIIHFGLCDWSHFKIASHKFSVTLTYGMTVIFGIIYFNENESVEIFRYLTNNNIYYLKDYFYIAYIVTLLSIIHFVYLSFKVKKLRNGINEIILLLIIFYLFDPLLSFAIYFCFFHTYKHLRHLITNVYLHLNNKKFVLLSTLVFTALSWFGGIAIVLYMSQNITLYESIIKVMFIGLAALTLPHMLLVDLVYRKKFN
tara:strand:- start:98 stop:913 length:816 start_codon:yes stop_codon:yes gene_type:complete